MGIRDRVKNETQRVAPASGRVGRAALRVPDGNHAMTNCIAMFRAQIEPSASPLPMPDE